MPSSGLVRTYESETRRELARGGPPSTTAVDPLFGTLAGSLICSRSPDRHPVAAVRMVLAPRCADGSSSMGLILFLFTARACKSRISPIWRRTICAGGAHQRQHAYRRVRSAGAGDAGRADYRKGVDDWHDAVAAGLVGEMRASTLPARNVALLIWGDPSLYDSLRCGSRGRLDPLPAISVIPGITSIQARCTQRMRCCPLNDIGVAVPRHHRPALA